MPEILFKIFYPNSSNMCFEFDAVVTINYKKTTNVASRNRDDEYVTIARSKLGNSVYCKWGTQTVYDKTWPTNQGGRVKIELKDILGNVMKTFHFTIKAQNPKIGEVMLYLDETPQNLAWFFKKMAMHESGTSSMDASAEMLQFNTYNSSLESLHTNWNHSSRCPNFSTNGDGGIGIMQLTDPKPHTQALWDWKCNVYGAYKLLTGNKQKILNQFEDFVWEHPTNPFLDHMVTKWDKANPTKKVVKLTETYAGYIWKFGASPLYGNGFSKINNYFNESLANGEKSVLDAWLTKLYNCYGCTAFLTASQTPPVNGVEQKPVWQLNWNNYTNEVFNQQVPIYK